MNDWSQLSHGKICISSVHPVIMQAFIQELKVKTDVLLMEEKTIPLHDVASVWIQTPQSLQNFNFPSCLVKNVWSVLVNLDGHLCAGNSTNAFGYYTKATLPKKVHQYVGISKWATFS